jgi:hypothetical protein
MHCFLVYPEYLLNQLKRGAGFKQALGNAIDNVLSTDQEVKDLIGPRRLIDALTNDQALKNLLMQKTRATYDDLVRRSTTFR